MAALVHRFLLQHEMEILRNWQSLLRIEPVVSPLAWPVCFEHLMPVTLAELKKAVGRRPPEGETEFVAQPWPPAEACLGNPYLAYYRSGEKAVLGVFGTSTPAEEDCRDLVRMAWRDLANHDIRAFGAFCRRASDRPEDCWCHAGVIVFRPKPPSGAQE